MNDQPDNLIQLGPVKKQSVRPPDPVIDEPVSSVGARPAGPGDNPEEMLAPYDDGVLLRCSPKAEAKHGEYVIHDGSGRIVAAAVNKQVANLICAAVHCYIRQAQALTSNMPPEVAAALENHAKEALAAQTPATPEAGK